MDDELATKFRETVLDEEQLKILAEYIDENTNFAMLLKENDENVQTVVDIFLKVSAEHQQKVTQLDEQTARYGFMLKMITGSLDGLEVDSDKVKAVEVWLKAVEIEDREGILDSTHEAAKAIKSIVISGKAFKNKTKGKGRPANKHELNHLEMWAYSVLYNVAAAEKEFSKSESSIKTARQIIKKFLRNIPSEQIIPFATQVVEGYENKKIKK